SEIGVLWIGTEVLKREHCDSVCYRMTDECAFPNIPTYDRCQCNQRRCKQSAAWIASHPLSATGEDSGTPRLNRLVPKPVLQIFGQRESRRVAALWIFLQTLQTNRGKLTIYFPIPQARLPRFSVEQ